MAHINEDIDFTVCAFIVHPPTETVFLIFHNKEKMWLPIGGHIELHEDPHEALLREIQEEFTHKVEVLGRLSPIHDEDTKPFPAPTFTDIHRLRHKPSHRHVSMIYPCIIMEQKDPPPHEEFSVAGWFTENQLDEMDLQGLLKKTIWYYSKESIRMVRERTIKLRDQPG